jgi:hypothetical protein
VLSESARATSAAEARYRVQAPNSVARVSAVVALDEPSEAVLQYLANRPWNQVTFLKTPIAEDTAAPPADGWLTDLAGRRFRIADQVAAADQVIMLAAAGGHAAAAGLVGRACSLRRVTTTALIVGAEHASDRELSLTLAQLRPWSLMVVLASSDDYITAMMTALRV